MHRIVLIFHCSLIFLACSYLQAEPSKACDRACLNGFVDQYLAALTAHDPARLPLIAGAKFTENGQQLHLGDGLWNTISARGSYSLYVDDPSTGQAGFFGTIVKTEHPQFSLCGSR